MLPLTFKLGFSIAFMKIFFGMMMAAVPERNDGSPVD